MWKPLLPLLFVFQSVFTNAQLFTDLNWNLMGLSGATAAFADYDNDGDEDFVLSGFGSTIAEWSGFYRIDNGIPVLIDSSLIKITNGSSNWGDFDHDGDPDLLMNGQTNGSAMCALYRNDGTSQLNLVSNTGLPGLIGCMRWIDYDRDQFPDVIMSGMIAGTFADTTLLFHNNGNGTFSPATAFVFSFFEADIQVYDYDGDSLPDFFITGRGSFGFNGYANLLHNDGNGQFSVTPNQFRQLFTGTSKFGDHDNDGDVDILYDGIDSTNAAFTLIYDNNNGLFTELPNVLPGSGEPGIIDWADIDNDGDLDIGISGSHLMRNDGNNLFVDVSPWDTNIFALPILFNDFDRDGDKDVLFVNYFGFLGTTMYQNNFITKVNNIETINENLIYPNPVVSKLNIKSQFNPESTLAIYSFTGELIRSPNRAFEQNEIDVACLSSGIYFLEIKNKDEVKQIRFVKM
ncbi:MAG: T9SS type A sorting domain-containing protein [Bacteroidetes bacterium]|nr:T9SS type A sorting domain-containing protein [Bacteroidota bacterium]MBK9541633.1 T9SS type A sorting domain-containing protein [Bacteroidota bacterium]